jgi:homogentisate phytyltransferase/homogentisate geranylgeranyltransferase
VRPAAGTLAAGRRSRGLSLGALWRFARPHTIVGTTISVAALYVIALSQGLRPGAVSLAGVMLAAWLVNVAIVGVNQIEDVELDRVNKPWLPLAAGELAPAAARRLVCAAALVALALAASQGVLEVVAVAAALAVGVAYSVPPLALRRSAPAALLSISLVRALAVNLGVYGHFAGGTLDVPALVWALTAFTLPFGAAIAVLKDVPDVAGDRAFRLRTFSVRFGPRPVFRLAVGWLALSYLAMAAAGLALAGEANVAIWIAGHLAALGALLGWARGARPDDPRRFTSFYMRVWLLFFCEYGLVALAAMLA